MAELMDEPFDDVLKRVQLRPSLLMMLRRDYRAEAAQYVQFLGMSLRQVVALMTRTQLPLYREVPQRVQVRHPRS